MSTVVKGVGKEALSSSTGILTNLALRGQLTYVRVVRISAPPFSNSFPSFIELILRTHCVLLLL